MKLTLTCIALVGLLLVGTAQSTVFPPKGEPGDRGDEVRCPDGHVLVGFSGRMGSWVDQISLMFARLVIPGFTTQDTFVLRPLRPARSCGC